MDKDVNLRYFSDARVVLDYARAAANVGLWASERVVFEKYIPKNASVLELGCGAGRVAFGLAELGLGVQISATDFSAEMIAMAQEIHAQKRAPGISFSVADAIALPFPRERFDGAIFAFNGFQMIPARERRAQALREVFRVLKPGGIFIFTGHDRTAPARKDFWEKERSRHGNAGLCGNDEEFGDQCLPTNAGTMFIHSADPNEMRGVLERAGFEILFSRMRSEICPETEAVREFSDETRFWVVRKKRGEGVPA